MVVSFAVNKFRGDPSLFTDGVKAIESRTGWPCRGVIPWLAAARALPSEDAVILEHAGQQAVAKAITEHKAADNPIYFRDPAYPGILVKEMPDGSRFSVRFMPNGSETVLAPIGRV